ncbi:c5orf44, putative [Babesia ovis]|uniref:C5orf44, putative n=1 Tax=Babesia ovis TaxID=5869 RepID=A0A9W5WV39_BABOV|nr:c5orf44, putative [Babesia ovis]
MAHDTPPNLVVMRLSPPTYESAAWQMLDTSDAIVALESETVDNVRDTSHMPMLVLPQYVNECFWGETLELSVMLSNPNKAPCTEVRLVVEVAAEDKQDEPIVMEPITNVTLESNTRPHQARVSYRFEEPIQCVMNFIVIYKFGKREYQVVKRALWKVVNPIQLEYIQQLDAIGRKHIETIVTNVSQLTISIKDVKLGMPDGIDIEPIADKATDTNVICVLRPNEAHSVVYHWVQCKQPMVAKISWHCHDRGAGEMTIPMQHRPQAMVSYNTVTHPGTVKIIQEFKIGIEVTNCTQEPIEPVIRLNEQQLKPLEAQVGNDLDVGLLGPAESRVVQIPFISTAKGLYNIRGVDIHVEPDVVVPVTDLQVVVM